MLNRSAVVVKPKQPFLDWLHHADPTSRGITLEQVGRTPRDSSGKSPGNYALQFRRAELRN